MSNQVFCQFKHIPSRRDGEQLVANIKTFVQPDKFDESGIRNCGEGGNDSIQFKLTRSEANRLRDRIVQVLPNESSPIWFHISSDPLNILDCRPLQTTVDYRHEGSTFVLSCQFGSLRSYNLFYSHASFNNKVVDVTFRPARQNPDSLVIEFDKIRLVIPFDAIQKKNILVNKQKKGNGVFVLIPLRYIPYMYRLEPVKSDGKDNQNSNMKQVRLCADSRNDNRLGNIENCSDLVFHFPESENTAWAFMRQFLEDRPYRYEINFSNFQILDWPRENPNRQMPNPFDYLNASHQDRYALQMLISLGFLFRDKWAQLTDQDLHWNTWRVEERYSLCCFAVEQLRNDHGYDLRRTGQDYNEKKKKKATKPDPDTDEKMVLAQNTQFIKVAVCTLTPMRTIVQPMEVTMGSRALRIDELGGPKGFLLVHFREEDNDRLRANNKNIKNRLKTAMLDGIELMNRKFIYIGASTGQMKEMAFWFIDLPPKLKSITDAHNLLGKVDTIDNIATYIARVGQYFSRTWPIGIKLTEVESEKDIDRKKGVNYVSRIPDIELLGADEYCFTDGVGKISWGLAGRIAQKMKLPLFDKKDIPSAFQVRVAGCKGMVAIDPNSTLDDYYMLVRKSMVKFESHDWNLEICDYARPLTLTLNNQVIRLLSDLGNHDDIFLALQNEGFNHWGIPEEQQTTGIEIAIQRSLSYSSSKDSLLKNRIPIPPTEGRNMFGVADETGELKYGECFIQYSEFNSANNGQRKWHVVTGTIIVTKNPCLWPGDFRRLEAVRNKKLEACMRDVIVFPTNGKRPHSNEISGSDLDGDQYWVYWGKRFTIEENSEPLSYKGAKKMTVRSIDHQKIIHHIVESFGAGIILGMIANTHTVVADKHEKHSSSAECRQLAELFALAVDSPKTGVFIEKEQIRPFQKKYCSSWPRYMKKFAEPVSDSNSILERLFKRAIERYQDPNAQIKMDSSPKGRTDVSMSEIVDKAFEKWLRGEAYEETPKENKSRKPRATKSDDEDESDSEPTASAKPKKTTTDDSSATVVKKSRKKPSEDTTKRPETPVVSKLLTDEKEPKEKKNTKASGKASASVQKESADTQNSVSLMNSDCKPSGASSKPSKSASVASSEASASASLNPDQFYLDFQMVSDPAITAAGNVEFLEAGGSWHIARPTKELSDSPERELIISKLNTYMTKQDVFKRNSPATNEALYGSLYLMVFYGHIYFVKQDSQKLDALQKSIKEKYEQILQFNYAYSDEFVIESASSSTTKKNKIDYELDCRLSSSSSSSENITLLFDKNKALQQIRVYHIWARFYIRLPNYTADNLYEIRSVLTHESGSSEFERISSSIFKGSSKKLLTEHKPNIKIDRDVLLSSVVPISLKIIVEDQSKDIDGSESESFYRKVRYVAINERQEKRTVPSTLEYHVTPIRKDILEHVCASALSPIEKLASSGKSGKSSTASNTGNAVRGFSMSDI